MRSCFVCLMVSGAIYWIVFALFVMRSMNVDWDDMDAGDCVSENRRFYYCVPSAVMIGCQKCGSTALANMLLATPQIKGRTGGNAFTVSRFKHDFWSRTFRSERILYEDYVRQDAFLLHSEDKQRGVITFEKSPDYMASEKAAREMREWMPSVKLLAILRDPISRAYSAFMWQCNKGRVVQRGNRVVTEKSLWADIVPYISPFRNSNSKNPMCTSKLFDKYLETAELTRYEEMDSVIGKGMYAIQLRQWMSHFDRSQFHVVLLEDFSKDQNIVLNDVLHFLGLESWRGENVLTEKQSNKGKYHEPMSESARAILKSVYEDSNKELAHMFPEINFRTWS